ncbi:hypothetical protein C0995_005944 [Termitomyces sp. Mi166|nr:hypothetical protein C0995_005944 [Termitomyces sp. Mi166\
MTVRQSMTSGVPSLLPSILGYQSFAIKPFYLDKTPVPYACSIRLFHAPSSECEHALFKTANSKDEGGVIRFIKGGHDYYNGRDFERPRHLEWLDKSHITRSGWKERHRELPSKSLA